MTTIYDIDKLKTENAELKAELAALREREEKLNGALGDVIDGYHEYDLRDFTGESTERCREIIKLWEHER